MASDNRVSDNGASNSIGGTSADAWPPASKPQLTILHDEYDYPATAKCSSCGQAMPTRQRWINSSADNLNWFADQFKLHLEKAHPDRSRFLKDPTQLGDSDTASAAEAA
jgi:hypothetical protein